MSGVETLEEIEASRKNGWTWPPNPLQIVAWIVLIVLALIHFLTLTPTIHMSWQPAVYAVPGVALLAHLICHLVTLTIDPADPQVINKNLPKIKFDRSKHSHVIENGFCYICQSDVAYSSKHCCVCNKCITDFDHHCKWLSTCIGGRNYRWFLATLVTGIVALVLVTMVSLAEFIAYFTDQDNRLILQPFRDLNATEDYMTAQFQLFYSDVPHIAWLVVVAIYIVLGAIAIGLVTHLFIFHIYLIKNDLTTYDYIILQRDKAEERKAAKEMEHYSNPSSPRTNKKNQVLPSTTCSGSKSKQTIRKTTTKSSLTHDMEISPTEGQSYSVNNGAGNWSDGETPPPSASPIHVETNNNNDKVFKAVDYADKTEIKRLRKKRRKRSSSSSSNHTSAISTIDNPRMYKDKEYTISRVDIPPIVTRPILPPPVPSPKAVIGAMGEYHSNTADSLLEVSPDKNPNTGAFGTMNSSNFGTLNSSLNLSFDATDGERKRVKKRVKKKKHVQEAEESEDELNSTTLFTVNNSAKRRSDGSLNYKDFRNLPLTPQMLRKKANKTDDDKHELDYLKPIVNERRYAKRDEHERRNAKLTTYDPKLASVPPLDFSALRGSHESVSFQPYTATFRSTDTVITDRLLPTLKEERQKLHTVTDTEV